MDIDKNLGMFCREIVSAERIFEIDNIGCALIMIYCLGLLNKSIFLTNAIQLFTVLQYFKH